MYHDIATAANRDRVGFSGAVAARYKLAPEAFEAHLDAIASTGLRVGLIEAGADVPPVVLTFDDGGASALDVAERLEARGWRGHFFVTTGRLGTPGFLDAPGVRDLASRGHAIGSHSHSHPTYMGRLAEAELEREWARSRALLGEALGSPPESASVPGGFLRPAVVAQARAAGYRVLMTSEPTGRVREAGGILLVGRYTIWATTPARTARAYAVGSAAARTRLSLEWKAKQLLKGGAPGLYEWGRRLRAGRGA
jgi:peptidoglycan/xylan/chitin deacetylase (PgdA/CDA1 family)